MYQYPLKWRGTPDRQCTGETVSLSIKYLRGINNTVVVSPAARIGIFSTIMLPGHELENHKITVTKSKMPKARSHVTSYRKILANFLAYRDGIPYPSNTNVDNNILSSITADEICRWFYFKAYGTPTPNDDARPQHARHTTLHF